MSSIDLFELKVRCGGTVFAGGKQWSGPGPGHSRRDRSLSVRIAEDGRTLFFSFAGDNPDDVRRHLGLDGVVKHTHPTERDFNHERQQIPRRRLQAAADAAKRKRRWCAVLWNETRDSEGSIIERYLHRRGIWGSIPSVLRFHPAAAMDYGAARRAPSMVALVQDHNGNPTGLHITALRPDGAGKAFGERSRRMFGDIAGGAVRLARAHDDLGIAEGIETALSFEALTGVPTWSALSATHLAHWRPPPGLQRLLIAADSDPAGMKAAHTLAERVRSRCDVTIQPAPQGRDWNDVTRAVARG